uniref:(northern house mosquito) hypothetical protein n=1 Tax=Culex pipiens TaxID=7175 RepID=A0A8D8GDZ3_CULPI
MRMSLRCFFKLSCSLRQIINRWRLLSRSLIRSGIASATTICSSIITCGSWMGTKNASPFSCRGDLSELVVDSVLVVVSAADGSAGAGDGVARDFLRVRRGATSTSSKLSTRLGVSESEPPLRSSSSSNSSSAEVEDGCTSIDSVRGRAEIRGTIPYRPLTFSR